MPDKLTPVNLTGLKSEDLKDCMIYHTTYKKGQILGCLHFIGSSNFEEAMNDAKTYCTNHGLRHIHTVNFLVDIKEPSEFEYAR